MLVPGQQTQEVAVIHYRTVADLNWTIRNNLHKVPGGTEVIAGVHRSGQLAAQILGAHLNLPVISFRNLRETHWIYAGYRSYIEAEEQDEYLRKIRKVLVVDDANTSGQTMITERQLFEKAAEEKRLPAHSVTYMSIYPAAAKVPGIDLHMEVVPGPRIFEWNWVNHSLLAKSCVDMDGVLCHDPSPAEWDEPDGAKQYQAFMKTARPLFLPKRGLRHVVTSRLEKWRDLTVDWFRKHHFDYGNLHMMPVDSPEARDAYGRAKWKAEVYSHLSETKLFFESDREEAMEIYARTGRPVFCVGTREMFQDGY